MTLLKTDRFNRPTAQFCAYDYDTQEWVEGDAAVLLRGKQLREELELPQGPRGDEYARFSGRDRSKSIASCLSEIGSLPVIS